MEITANILADSINKYTGDRITTFILRYPRYIHTHVLTHRAFVRNTASSRAIPISKYIDVVTSDCAMPSEFRLNKKGMQSGETLSNESNEKAVKLWLEARDNAVNTAKEMIKLNVSKESVNRLLEPFMWIECILTATEFNNFFSQRISELAQPEMCTLATKMQRCMLESTPKILFADDCWHLPYRLIDKDVISNKLITFGVYGSLYEPLVCSGQVARVSYTKFNDSDRHTDVENYKLSMETLIPHKHWSPLEHCAIVEARESHRRCDMFSGFRSLRNIVSNFISNK